MLIIYTTTERPDARQIGQLQPSSVDCVKETVIPGWDYKTTTVSASRCKDETQEH